MAINPMDLMRAKRLKDGFEKRHAKVVAFAQRVIAADLPEGTILELTITKPGEEPKTCNMRVTAEDVEAIAQLKKMNK